MVDDSWDISTILDFHSCDTPHGMRSYILETLTPEQKAKLNIWKREQVRSDHKYLAQHPEIRGIIMMILRLVMRTKAKSNIHEVIGKYFAQSSMDIKEEVRMYLRRRGQDLDEHRTQCRFSFHDEGGSEKPVPSKIKQVEIVSEKTESLPKEENEALHKQICRDIINEILETVVELQMNVEQTLGSIDSFDFGVDYDYDKDDPGSV